MNKAEALSNVLDKEINSCRKKNNRTKKDAEILRKKSGSFLS